MPFVDHTFIEQYEDGALLRAIVNTSVKVVDRALNGLKNIPNRIWQRLQHAGMTGTQLRIKWELWWEDLLAGKFKLILRRLDSLLKSLASVIHLAEILEEYKQHVEMTMIGLENAKLGDCTNLIVLGSPSS